VLVAGSPDEAAALAGAGAAAIHLIISDYQLAGRATGFEAIAAVRATLGRAVPAVIITGDTSSGPRAAAAIQGYRLLYKPIEPDILLELVENIPVPPGPPGGGLS